jgi:hypothetical protein
MAAAAAAGVAIGNLKRYWVGDLNGSGWTRWAFVYRSKPRDPHSSWKDHRNTKSGHNQGNLRKDEYHTGRSANKVL